MRDLIYFAAALGAFSLAMLLVSLHLRRRHRLLSDLPTSKAHGVFLGLVELKGTAEAETPLRSFLSGQACVHYAYAVDEHWSRTVTETYTDKDGRMQTRTRHESGWTNVAQGGETIPFYVQDDTGAVLVRPQGAKIEPLSLFDATVSRADPLYYAKGPPHAVSHSDHRRRFAEQGLPLHASLYLVGQARERQDVVAPEIAAGADVPVFLISTRSEEKVLTGYAAWSWVCWVLGLPAAVAATAILRQPFDPVLAAAGAAAFFFAWSVGWVWMVYNSLVSLRERVRQAWSLIDVQLKRRHDLIPGLVAVVGGLRDHEADVQESVAALRAQLTATPPGQAGPDPDGLAARIRTVVERYPQLKSDAGFSRLHATLVETEQRIALARTYYNDIATHFATRLERVPECWVARLGAMSPPALLTAGGFERASVKIDFAP